MFNAAGIQYLYIYPVRKSLKSVEFYSYWGMVYNGSFKGLYTTNQIIYEIGRSCGGSGGLLKIHVHHLKNIELDKLKKILDTFDENEIFLYGHDYYLICNQYNLMRNGKEYCGIGRPCKEKCGNCLYLQDSHEAEERVAFVEKYAHRVKIITPSDAAGNIIRRSLPELADKVTVIYHQKLIGEYRENIEPVKAGDKLKIAFCGLQLDIKGWPQFLETVYSIKDNNPGYEFYHLGRAKRKYDHIKNIEVGFQDGMLTMTEALRKYKIDCVVLWSQCAETYSYVYYECCSANTFIITHENSGNVADMVKRNKNGVILKSQEQLYELLADKEKIIRMINDMRQLRIFGPQRMEDNDAIVDLSLCSTVKYNNEIHNMKKTIKQTVIEILYKRNIEHKKANGG